MLCICDEVEHCNDYMHLREDKTAEVVKDHIVLLLSRWSTDT